MGQRIDPYDPLQAIDPLPVLHSLQLGLSNALEADGLNMLHWRKCIIADIRQPNDIIPLSKYMYRGIFDTRINGTSPSEPRSLTGCPSEATRQDKARACITANANHTAGSFVHVPSAPIRRPF